MLNKLKLLRNRAINWLKVYFNNEDDECSLQK